MIDVQIQKIREKKENSQKLPREGSQWHVVPQNQIDRVYQNEGESTGTTNGSGQRLRLVGGQ